MKFEQLHLDTGPLEAMRKFYANTLGFRLLHSNPDSFSVAAGETQLTFHKVEGNPYYHFAFNIPSFSILSAADWLRERTELLPWQGSEIIDFSDWNAEAVYFYDPAGNIVEFIARKNLNVRVDEDFEINQVLGISEMGWSSNNTESFHNRLLTEIAIEDFDCNPWRFCAVGSETGLFIMIDPAQKKWIPNMEEAVIVPFRCRVTTDRSYDLKFDGEDLSIEGV